MAASKSLPSQLIQAIKRHAASFASALLEWNAGISRPMPWRDERDPYRIWLSEVILQQTRVAQGWDYYQRFVERFPDVASLADASEDEVLRLWQGLGYYRRAKNLHAAAKEVRSQQIPFPSRYTELLQLPGIGPYSAAAIASFAANEDVAVVDGNVYRVLARFFGVDQPIDKPKGQKLFASLASELLPQGKARAYNQAIMDFGALLCTPRNPQCPSCPLQLQCQAFQEARVSELPRKEGRINRRSRSFDYLHLCLEDDSLLVHRRGDGDIWAGLYELVLLESTSSTEPDRPLYLQDWGFELASAQGLSPEAVTPLQKHQLTHQDLWLRIWRFRLSPKQAAELVLPKGQQWVSRAMLDSLALPKPLVQYFHKGSSGLPFVN